MSESESAWPPLMKDSTVAKYIDASRRQVWKLVAEQKLPEPISVPGTRSKRWRKTEVDAALATWGRDE